MSQFEYHEIKWDGEKVNRIWNYFTKIQKSQTKWFAELMSSGIINYCKHKGVEFKNLQILDYGAGKGFLADLLLTEKKIGKVDVGEFSKEGLEFLKNRYNQAQSRVIDLSATPSKIEDSSYDVVFLIEVVEHLDNFYLEETRKEVYRILKPGGLIIITTPYNEDLESNKVCCPDCGSIFHRVQHIQSWTLEGIKERFNNFKPIIVKNTNFFIYKKDLPITKRFLNLIKRLIFINLIKKPHLIYVGKKDQS